MKRKKYFKGFLPAFLYIDDMGFINTMFYNTIGKIEKFHSSEKCAIKFLNKYGYTK